MKSIKILSYAVNGSGLGHLTRLLALNRWLERLALACGTVPQQCFLTTSEADTLVWRHGYASFKLPSKTAVRDSRMPIEDYMRLARQWVLGAINLWQPDILIVDTFPNGSFQELVTALEGVRHRVFIYRELKEAFAARQSFQALLPLYQQVLVPHFREEGEPQVPSTVKARLTYSGPMLLREPCELLSPSAARHRLGIPSDAVAVYLSAGGGGDEAAERTLNTLIDVLSPDPSLHLVVAAGPLFRGSARRGPRLTWLTDFDVGAHLHGIDLAISASGYNSFSELLSAGVPTLFFAQEKIADIQAERVERAVQAGAARAISFPLTPEAIRAAVDALRQPTQREALAQAARRFIPHNGARLAAARILSAVLPAEDVEEAVELVTPAFVGLLQTHELTLEDGLRAARLLGAATTRTERRLQRLLVQEALEAHGLGSGAGRSPLTADALERRFPEDVDGTQLGLLAARWLSRWHDPAQARDACALLELFLKRSRLTRVGELEEGVQDALMRLLSALVAFQDPRAAALAVQALPRAAAGPDVLNQAAVQLEDARGAGKSLYLLLAELGGAYATD